MTLILINKCVVSKLMDPVSRMMKLQEPDTLVVKNLLQLYAIYIEFGQSSWVLRTWVAATCGNLIVWFVQPCHTVYINSWVILSISKIDINWID